VIAVARFAASPLIVSAIHCATVSAVGVDDAGVTSVISDDVAGASRGRGLGTATSATGIATGELARYHTTSATAAAATAVNKANDEMRRCMWA
jgi:hypothetical protein